MKYIVTGSWQNPNLPLPERPTGNITADLKKPLYCTPQEDNDYGEIPEGISAEDFEEPDAMPF